MTDNEIIKALEICASGNCEGCNGKHGYDCVPFDAGTILSLINRQKAEIEVLSQKRANIFENISFYEKGRAEAIEEFAERLKEALYRTEFGTPVVDVADIDNLVKEMVGEDNG